MATAIHRVHNFNAGPAALPLAVLEEAQRHWTNFQGTGMGVMELSHRSKAYMAVQASAEARVRRLMGLGEEWAVLFLQGGASQQFAMVPMNLSVEGQLSGYVVGGEWGKKALAEAKKWGPAVELASSAATKHDRLPGPIAAGGELAYVHLTTNNTIEGTQHRSLPRLPEGLPWVLDASSDVMSHPLDLSQVGLLYAGAQKNLGPSGVTLVLVRKELMQRVDANRVPAIFRYTTHAEADSLYNTPPTLAIYLLDLVLAWVEEQGGLPAMARRAEAKAARLYGVIDAFPEVFEGHAQPEARSQMNVVWRLKEAAREADFLAGAKQEGFEGLAGHRSVGGLRASIYNAVEPASVEALAQYMEAFARRA